MKKLLILLLILSNSAYAGNAVRVRTGDIVQPEFDQGTLLDKEQANKVKDQLIERDGLEKENISYKKSLELHEANKVLYQQENTLLLNRNIELSKAVNDSRSRSTWEVVGYISLGVFITGFGVWGASKLTK